MPQDTASAILQAVEGVGRKTDEVSEQIEKNAERVDLRFDEVNRKIDTLNLKDQDKSIELANVKNDIATIKADRADRIPKFDVFMKEIKAEVEELKMQVQSWKGGTAVLFGAMTLIATAVAIWKGIH